MKPLRELSLYTGAGGGVLASKLLGHKVVGYVEIGEYQRKIIRCRIDDGSFDNAPIFCDIRKFISEGYAASYSGMVDLVSGGFPCQPFSRAGKQLGESDSRNMWPETNEVIGIIKPRRVFLENVPGLLDKEYFQKILRDLAEGGFDAKWCVLSAREVGARHLRERLWILAFANSGRCVDGEPKVETTSTRKQTQHFSCSSGSNLSNPNFSGLQVKHEIGNGGQKGIREKKRREFERVCSAPRSHQWEVEPGMGRVVDGLAYRIDRVKAIGNGQVPAVAATAFRILSEVLI